MKIAVIGAGRVGATLGTRLGALGHDVRFGVRDPARAPVTPTSHPHTAVADADVVLLATPWRAALELVPALPLDGRIVIDATNPLGPGRTLAVGHTTSGAEQLAAAAPKARVVKAFNTIGVEGMADPRFGRRAATLPIAGDDGEACRITAALAAELGFEPIVLGPLSLARALEPLAALWIELALHEGQGRELAVALVHRAPVEAP